ncbi:MAG: hypothetical protein ACHQD8_05495 [Chitinophagales bacterium]
MEKILFALLLAIIVPIAFTAHAQTDNEQIMHAKNAIQVTNNCDEALRYLDKVSINGKMTADYFLYMAKANDCKSNNEQAIYYYKKYLEFQPASDSIKKRVAELSDQKTRQARVANEERVAKASYQTVSKNKKKKHMSIDDNFMLLGVSYDIGLGGENAPYKKEISINYSGNFPIIHNHVTLGYTLNSGFLFSPNKKWFGSVFDMPDSEVSGVGLGFAERLSFVPMAVIINRHKLSLTAGPEIGVGFFYTPEVTNSYGGAASFNDGGDFGISYGLRTNLLVGDNVAFFIEYTTFSIKSVSSDYAGITQSTPVSHDMFQIGIGYRLERWGLGWGWGWW